MSFTEINNKIKKIKINNKNGQLKDLGWREKGVLKLLALDTAYHKSAPLEELPTGHPDTCKPLNRYLYILVIKFT